MKKTAYFLFFLVMCFFDAVRDISKAISIDLRKHFKLYFSTIVDNAMREARYRLEWGWNDTRTFSNMPCYNTHFANMGKVEDRAEDWFDQTVQRKENAWNKNVKLNAINKLDSFVKARAQSHAQIPDGDFDTSRLRQEVKEM